MTTLALGTYCIICISKQIILLETNGAVRKAINFTWKQDADILEELLYVRIVGMGALVPYQFQLLYPTLSNEMSNILLQEWRWILFHKLK